MNELCQWEINWINSHPERYEGPLHQKAVIRLITNKYALKAAQQKVDKIINDENMSTGRTLAVAFNELMLLTP